MCKLKKTNSFFFAKPSQQLESIFLSLEHCALHLDAHSQFSIVQLRSWRGNSGSNRQESRRSLMMTYRTLFKKKQQSLINYFPPNVSNIISLSLFSSHFFFFCLFAKQKINWMGFIKNTHTQRERPPKKQIFVVYSPSHYLPTTAFFLNSKLKICFYPYRCHHSVLVLEHGPHSPWDPISTRDHSWKLFLKNKISPPIKQNTKKQTMFSRRNWINTRQTKHWNKKQNKKVSLEVVIVAFFFGRGRGGGGGINVFQKFPQTNNGCTVEHYKKRD